MGGHGKPLSSVLPGQKSQTLVSGVVRSTEVLGSDVEEEDEEKEEGDEDESVVVGDVVEEVVVDRVVVVVDSSVVLTVEVGSVDSVVGSLVLYVVVLAVVIDGSVVGTGGASLLVSAEQSSPHLQSLSSGTIFEAISEQT